MDDLGVGDLEDHLCKTFVDFYNYTAERCLIRKQEDPDRRVFDFMVDLMHRGYMEAGCLVMVVFSGHGEISLLPTGKYEIVLAPP